jgi:hypothetical protein
MNQDINFSLKLPVAATFVLTELVPPIIELYLPITPTIVLGE